MTVLDVAPTLDATSLARWQANPITFIEECLHDPETRKPYRLLPAERAFLEHAFQTDAGGRLKYPEQLYACPKKSGKTAFAALHCLTTTLLFGGWYPEATICANDLEQSVGRVFEAIRKIVVCSPLLRAEAKITEGRITFPAIDAAVMAIASDYAGAAGVTSASPASTNYGATRRSAAGVCGMSWCRRRRARWPAG
jgi:hypothetical protein